MMTLEVWNIFFNSLIYVCITGLQNGNITGWSELHKISRVFFFLEKKKKTVNYSWQSFDAIFEEVSLAKTIVWC